MTNMRVWKFLSPNPDKSKEFYNPRANLLRPAIYAWAKFDGKSRFGWSTSNLHNLSLSDKQVNAERKKLEQAIQALEDAMPGYGAEEYLSYLNPKEIKEWRDGAMRIKTEIKPGDWIIHLNVPCQGRFLAVQVVGEYGYDRNEGAKDFRHFIPVDASNAWEGNRKDYAPPVEAALYSRSRLEEVNQSATLEALAQIFAESRITS